MRDGDAGPRIARETLNRLPFVGPALARAKRLLRTARFPGSSGYWETRYRNEGTSGPGSYGRLAIFKAEVLNRFVQSHEVQTVLEFGCGDGNQLSHSEYPQYVGLDVSRHAIDICSKRFQLDPTKSFFLYDPFAFSDPLRVFRADLTLSLDVIFHLVEESVFEAYMTHVFGGADRFVMIYSSNHEGAPAPHVRDRRFTDWVERFLPGWSLVERIPNRFPFDPEDTHNTSHSEFFVYARISK